MDSDIKSSDTDKLDLILSMLGDFYPVVMQLAKKVGIELLPSEEVVQFLNVHNNEV